MTQKIKHNYFEFIEEMDKKRECRKFDCVIMNPPYQSPKNLKEGGKKGTIGGDLWSKFVKIANKIVFKDGYVCAIHPPMWRKPEHELYSLLKNKNMLYLEMHSEKDGIKTFDAATKYDWYVLQNSEHKGKTEIIDEIGERHEFNLKEYDWLPNFEFDLIESILAKEGETHCEIIYSSSMYDVRKSWMSDKEDEQFKYPCVYSMAKEGFECHYSSEKKGFGFEKSKVILGIGRHLYPTIDMEGNYGLTQIAFAISVNSKEEAEKIKKAIESEEFTKIVKATKWGAFQTDWRMFKYFRKDFWKEFI